MLQSFVPLFVMTFLICLFIVLMQFLWRYVDDLVGKGLGINVIAELFLYAALTMVPMALPLAILLASLMTFGNLGERFELTALKASGISLLRTMKPLIILMVFVAIGAFFFQNNVLPVAQAKMYTLLYSMRQKSPELDIPEGAFYDQIPGFNLYVKEKDRETGMLRDVMIYDVSRGFDNTRVILADSGDLAVTPDKTHLYLTLHSGELFENLREATVASSSGNMPYRREAFSEKQILIAFDANFNRMDESGMRNQYVGKDMAELRATIDSVKHRLDSIGSVHGTNLRENAYVGLTYYTTEQRGDSYVKVPRPAVALAQPLDIDTLFQAKGPGMYKSYLNQAINRVNSVKHDYEFKSYTMQDDNRTLRRHGIELMKKFTLSLACIVFFFIGAPLGAIIRKGGLGMPLVISVLLFIFYYIIDNTGTKLARDGRLEVWEGVWLSTMVLLPLGIFFTYKAVNDSAVFNRDAYVNFFRRLLGRHEVRHLTVKEVVMEDVERPRAEEMVKALDSACEAFMAANRGRQRYWSYWLTGYSRREIHGISALLEHMVAYMANSRDKLVIAKLNDYPVLRSLWLYHPTNYRWLAWGAMIVFPIGLSVYLAGVYYQRLLINELRAVMSVDREIMALLARDTADSEATNAI
ncbi:MAG: LptF/LptG family permease [Muribaculaceae bacterium]|nr:LptF/LptG family permease [Muribaculaceae bacterium]